MFKTQLEKNIRSKIDLSHFELINESGNHAHSSHEYSHIKLVIVSKDFEQLTRIKRHALINEIIFKLSPTREAVHAASYLLFTPDEWKASTSIRPSPPCKSKIP